MMVVVSPAHQRYSMAQQRPVFLRRHPKIIPCPALSMDQKESPARTVVPAELRRRKRGHHQRLAVVVWSWSSRTGHRLSRTAIER